jgi:bacteriocin-like protein
MTNDIHELNIDELDAVIGGSECLTYYPVVGGTLIWDSCSKIFSFQKAKA